MTKDEHKAWLDGLKPGDTVVSAYTADHPTYDWVATVVRRTAHRIVVKRGAVHIQCEAKNGDVRGGHHCHAIYPLTDVMRKNACVKAEADWCGYQSTRDLPRLTPENQATVKALADKLLGEQKAAGKISGHTPEQAAALWCPMVRTVRWECDKSGSNGESFGDANAIGGCNSGGMNARNPHSSRCIADSCAMWRWETHYNPVDMPGAIRRSGTGYCGLANIPMQVTS